MWANMGKSEARLVERRAGVCACEPKARAIAEPPQRREERLELSRLEKQKRLASELPQEECEQVRGRLLCRGVRLTRERHVDHSENLDAPRMEREAERGADVGEACEARRAHCRVLIACAHEKRVHRRCRVGRQRFSEAENRLANGLCRLETPFLSAAERFTSERFAGRRSSRLNHTTCRHTLR